MPTPTSTPVPLVDWTTPTPTPTTVQPDVANTPTPYPTVTPSPTPTPTPTPHPDWKAWPGGLAPSSLNPPEKFKSTDFGLSGSADWTVDKGAVIVETGGSTASGYSEINVRYGQVSASSQESDAVTVKCAVPNPGEEEKKRTVFKCEWTNFKTAGALHAKNKLRFFRGQGANDACGYHYDANAGVVGKMEAELLFTPAGIDWDKLGIIFVFSDSGKKGARHFRLHRYTVRTLIGSKANGIRWLGGAAGGGPAAINDDKWILDGNSDKFDAQYPTAVGGDPNRAFRIDEPFFGGKINANNANISSRATFIEVGQWYDDENEEWINLAQTTRGGSKVVVEPPDPNEGGKKLAYAPHWHFTLEVINQAKEAARSKIGIGAAPKIRNTKPVVNGSIVSGGAIVTEVPSGGQFSFDLDATTDADSDFMQVYSIKQTQGPNVVALPKRGSQPTAYKNVNVTAPTVAADTVVKFEIDVLDTTARIKHYIHLDDTQQLSETKEFTLTVKKP